MAIALGVGILLLVLFFFGLSMDYLIHRRGSVPLDPYQTAMSPSSAPWPGLVEVSLLISRLFFQWIMRYTCFSGRCFRHILSSQVLQMA